MPTTCSGLITELFHIEFLAFSNTFQTSSMLDVVEEYNASESTGGIMETNNTHMEVHNLTRLVPVPLSHSVKKTMLKDRELHPM